MDRKQNMRQDLANVYRNDVSKAQENQPNYFDTLPDELHLEILKKLPQLELDSLGLVSRRLNRIVEDKSLWKKMVVRHFFSYCKRVDLGTLMRRQVQQLFLEGVTIPSPPRRTALEATQPNWSLKELSLCHVKISPDNLVLMLNTCKQLRKVDLQGSCGNKEVFVALSENKNIENLSLIHLLPLDLDGLEFFLKNARKLQEFQTVHFDQMLNNSMCENVPPSLLHLKLGTWNDLINDIPTIMDHHIAQIVRKSPLLESLDLKSTNAPGLTVRSIESLRNLEHLRILKMPRCSGIPFAAYLPLTEMESLVELDVSQCRLDPRNIEQLLRVNVIDDRDYHRIGTFTTRHGVVKITY